MLKTYLCDTEGVFNGAYHELRKQWQAAPEKTLWVDVTIESHDEAAALMSEFGIHALAMEDALRKRHPPKIEFFDNCIFILYRGISTTGEELVFEHLQVALFVGENFLITLHREPSMGINTVTDIFENAKLLSTHKKFKVDAGRILPPLQIALNILHGSSSVYLDNILGFEARLSDLEDELEMRGDDSLLSELTLYKSRLLKLRRTFDYHKGIADTLRYDLADSELSIPDYLQHHINGLHDRFTRISTLVQMHYDICGDLIEGYLSIASHRLNVTMRVLTVITAVFVPLSFIAGVYGMNFTNMPELNYRYGYFVLIAFMATLASVLLFIFRRKKWI